MDHGASLVSLLESPPATPPPSNHTDNQSDVHQTSPSADKSKLENGTNHMNHNGDIEMDQLFLDDTPTGLSQMESPPTSPLLTSPLLTSPLPTSQLPTSPTPGPTSSGNVKKTVHVVREPTFDFSEASDPKSVG